MAIYDKISKEARIIPAPMHVVQPSLKAHYGLKGIAESAEDRANQRATLGVTFGTKRAARNVRLAERNKLDVTADDLLVLQPILHASLTDVLSEMPSAEDLLQLDASAKPIPPLNKSASVPEQIYPLYEIVSKEELESVPIKLFTQASNHTERVALLACKNVSYVDEKLMTLFLSANANSTKKSAFRNRLRLIIYLSYLVALLNLFKMEDVPRRLGQSASELIISNLLERFTEESRNAQA